MDNYNKLLKIFFCLIVLFLPAGLAGAQEYRVHKLSFSGFKQVSASAARKTMVTKSPSFFFWNKNPVFNETALQQDIRRVANYCKNEGFFDATASYTLKYENRSVDILITATEGLPYYVESTTVTINDSAPPVIVQALENKVTIKTGEIFKIGQFDETKKEFNDYLKKSGYGAASVAGKVIIDRTARTIAVVIPVITGPVQYFGGTAIKNNTYVKSGDIMAQVSFREGDKFLADELENTRMNIYGLNLFKTVTVNPVISTGTVIPVEINVTEKSKRSIKLGLGYGAEDNFRVSAGWTRYYLADEPRTLTLSAKNSSIISNFTASLAQPFFMNRKTGLTGTLSLDREDITSYTNEKLTLLAKVDRKYFESLHAFTGYSLEMDRPVNIKVDISEEIKATLPDKLYLISGVLFGASYNTIKTLLPENGVFYSIFLEQASYLLGSEIDYTKGVAEGQNFAKISDNLVFAARVKYGVILPQRDTAEIPIFKRFFSGGGASVRGYGFHEIGPVDIYGTPLGGHYLFEYSVELQQHLSTKSNLVAFLDAGEVHNTAFIASELKYGTGLGLRYATPIGPLGFDAGFPLNPGNSVDLNQYRLYFSLGQAF
ncbi:MAG: hypothetical protein A2297_05355 [Elusimicrobia bacterium RIFOXYB2_FULL_48_7]|nr:MAG: hypothetical protein A2297_05355 [Elusimicrobia bacterium RIFOXYB2_FULL_48_7]